MGRPDPRRLGGISIGRPTAPSGTSATLGRFDDADTACAAAAELERSAGFPRSSPAPSTGMRGPSSIEMRRTIERARALLNDVIDVTDRLGMALLHRQARSSREQLDARPIL